MLFQFIVGDAQRTERSMGNEQPTPGGIPLKIEGVSKTFAGRAGPIEALHPLDVDVAAGEFVCLLGPSGCGKSTTLNIIGGFVEPDDGEVLIDGSVVNKIPPYRRPVNTVFQSYALFPHMTVEQNVRYGLHGLENAETERRTEEILQSFRIASLAKRRPRELSGGERQRAALARALSATMPKSSRLTPNSWI